MKPKLLMICLLRSSAAALATHPRGGGGSGVVVASSSAGRRTTRRNFFPFTQSRHDDNHISSSSDAAPDTIAAVCTTSTSLHQTSRRATMTDSIDSTITPSSSSASSPLLTSGHIAFRLARRTDVKQIQSCNLATLPENYNANFYVNHMRTWPELTLVAEHIPEGFDLYEDENDDPSKITPLREYIGRKRASASYRNGSINNDGRPQKEIVGYILGKVEERPIHPARQIFPPSRVPLYDDEETLLQYMAGNANGARLPPTSRIGSPLPNNNVPKEKIGHVTSLAVHSHARRLGIASSLLHQLHYHLEQCYGANSIGLHVRISNKAAVRLYCEEGYDVADIIPLYYGDGEDAYFMRKDFNTNMGSMEMMGSDEQRQRYSSRRQQQQQQQQRNEQQQQPSQRQWRRGERERNEWLNRDATRGGNFFDNRKSMRDTLSEEERAWVNNNGNAQISNNNQARRSRSSMMQTPPQLQSSSSLSGQFKRSFRTFFNGGEQMQSQRQVNQFRLPPWEIGPEGLRLPRYSKVCRKQQEQEVVENNNGVIVETTRSMSVNDLVTQREEDEEGMDDNIVMGDNDYEDDGIIIESYEEEGDELALDARLASGSV